MRNHYRPAFSSALLASDSAAAAYALTEATQIAGPEHWMAPLRGGNFHLAAASQHSEPQGVSLCPSHCVFGPRLRAAKFFFVQICPGAAYCAPDLLVRRGVLALPFCPASRLFCSAEKKGLWGHVWFFSGWRLAPTDTVVGKKVEFPIAFFPNAAWGIRFRGMIRPSRCRR